MNRSGGGLKDETGFLFLEIRGPDSIKRLEIPGEHFRGGETEIDGNFLDRRSVAEQVACGDHAFLPEPFLRDDADAFLKNTTQVSFGYTDSVAQSGQAVFPLAGDLAQRERQGFAGEKNLDSSVLLDDFNVATFHLGMKLVVIHGSGGGDREYQFKNIVNIFKKSRDASGFSKI